MRQETYEWLKQIPIGEYTLMQLVFITKRDKAAISRVFKKLGVKKKAGQFTHHNMVEILYIWEGI